MILLAVIFHNTLALQADRQTTDDISSHDCSGTTIAIQLQRSTRNAKLYFPDAVYMHVHVYLQMKASFC